MSEIYPIKKSWEQEAKVNKKEYDDIYKNSISKNDEFWSNHGKRIEWFKPYTKIKDVTYSKDKVDIRWFYDGKTNVSYNCVDRYARVILIKLL